MTTALKLTSVALIGGFIAALIVLSFTGNRAFGSVPTGQEYYSTTTVATSFPPIRLLKTGGGSLNSVVITGAQTGAIDIYNATTSNVTQRTGQKATSTILLAQFPASAAAGTYTFDSTFTDGLLIVTASSPSVPTSTITWR